MTAHKHLKERIRARMARTGESYTTARRHVLNALPPAEYRLTGGVHPDTHAIAGVLANRGLLDPHSGRPLTEAMVLGVGGGLGAGYILWEFKAHDLRTLVFGFRNSWQYPDRWALKTCARLGVPAGPHETGSPRQAEQELSAAVGQGVPVIAWADQQALGYRHLPAWLEGYGGHPVTIYGIDERAGVALVDDRNRAPLTVPLDALAAPGSGSAPTGTGSWPWTPRRPSWTPTGSARRSATAWPSRSSTSAGGPSPSRCPPSASGLGC
jgi:hypothetical protein